MLVHGGAVNVHGKSGIDIAAQGGPLSLSGGDVSIASADSTSTSSGDVSLVSGVASGGSSGSLSLSTGAASAGAGVPSALMLAVALPRLVALCHSRLVQFHLSLEQVALCPCLVARVVQQAVMLLYWPAQAHLVLVAPCR